MPAPDNAPIAHIRANSIEQDPSDRVNETGATAVKRGLGRVQVPDLHVRLSRPPIWRLGGHMSVQ